jgi:hypothetical protein
MTKDEETRLRTALHTTLFALEFIASGSCPDPQRAATTVLRQIEEKYGFTQENA